MKSGCFVLWIVWLLFFTLFVGAAAGPGNGGRAEDLGTLGERFFVRDCSACHGLDGRGQGPEAPALRTPPADLTQIAQRRGGQFPAAEIAAYIDGRAQVRAHGSCEMPLWGERFSGQVGGLPWRRGRAGQSSHPDSIVAVTPAVNHWTEDRIMTTVSSPWAIATSCFPETGTMADKLRFLIAYAILAPSSHNTQPWRFQLRDHQIDLYADRTRALPVMDPDDRALIMSCGAALYNLCLAVRHFGYTDTVTLFPDATSPDLVARIDVDHPGHATDEEHDLFWAIPVRRTNRHLYRPQPVPTLVVKRLETIARAEGASFHVVQGDARRHAVADLIAEADRIQWADKRFRRELAAWLHPERHHSRDGIPGYAFGVSETVAYTGTFLLRTFDWGRGQAAKDRQLAAGSPLLAVLATETDTPTAWLEAGQALERVLLQACAAGLSTSYLNQPIEVTDLRQRLGDLVGISGYPQLLVRMGYGPEVEPTPRRGVDEVIR